MAPVTIPIVHFNDVYRVRQVDKKTGGRIGADQFAAKIAKIRQSWGEPDDLANLPPPKTSDDERQVRDWTDHATKRQRKGLVLFSGDLYSPSVESSVTRGTHLVPVINAMNLDCACLGNHDWDFGYPHLQTLMAQNNFPWLFSNVVDAGSDDKKQPWDEDPGDDDAQVPGTLQSWTTTVAGVKVGCIGIVEKEWIATVPSFPPSFVYRNMAKTALRLSEKLRDPQGEACELVIAITHSRLPNDIDFANAVGAVANADASQHGVDLVLGGHDHVYYVGNGAAAYEGDDFSRGEPGTEKDKGAMVVKSGTDFRDLSELKLELSDRDDTKVRRRTIQRLTVKRYRASPDDPTSPELAGMLDELLSKVSQSTGQAVAHTITPWDVRSEKVRTDESAIGDFVADVLMESYEDLLRERDNRGELEESRPPEVREVDCCIICGGSLRGDQVYGPGKIALSDVLEIMPFEDAVVCKELKGQDIWDALENGLGMYPKQEGRFPQVAGIKVQWDSRKPPGKRLREGEGGYSVTIHRPALRIRGPLEMDKTYRVVTREYLAEGYDGFEALKRGREVVDHENGQLMSAIVRRFLLGASYIWRMKQIRQLPTNGGGGGGGPGKAESAADGDVTMEDIGAQAAATGRDEEKTLSKRTKEAILRARALGLLQKGAKHGHADAIEGQDNAATPRKKPGVGAGERFEMIVDQSPGGFRDALHIGGSEHHSAYDPVSKRFASASASSGRQGARRQPLPRTSTGAHLPTSPIPASKRPKVARAQSEHARRGEGSGIDDDDDDDDGGEDGDKSLEADGAAKDLFDPSDAPTLLARIRHLCNLLEQVGGKDGRLAVPAESSSADDTTTTTTTGTSGGGGGEAQQATEAHDETSGIVLGATTEDDMTYIPTLSAHSAKTHPTPLSDAIVSETRSIRSTLLRLRAAADRLEDGEMNGREQDETIEMLRSYLDKQAELASRFGATAQQQGGGEGGRGGCVNVDVEVDEEDVERFREASDELAVISPLVDGRLVDLARQ
ncbi:uncharacterized protein PFL1_01095 [Pseudozyma flocculosa PF-1]|uniref:uncharacterized protein n=1 Tax=Pseudozyma flocculosa PF-1 TaxID=1277687 RepID=UPI0004560DD8|nr:uncharacterized protein PFL1_01095 [Pseudozyma flocculosa PF-1]EPQ31763.1 hypothetical protein PFL1_01095 [Pseudozyma flocculosa PF-1]